MPNPHRDPGESPILRSPIHHSAFELHIGVERSGLPTLQVVLGSVFAVIPVPNSPPRPSIFLLSNFYFPKMHRFYIPPENWNPDHLSLTGGEAHHAGDVLRLKTGDKAVLFNGCGREVTAELTQTADNNLRFRRLTETETPPLKCRITLGQAIPKGKNMDLIVQKAVEIGVAEICPLMSQRTVVDLDTDAAAHKQAKWQQVAIEAAKQCGQNWLPTVQQPRTLKGFFASSAFIGAISDRPSTAGHGGRAFDLQLIGSLQPDAQHLKKVLSQYSTDHGGAPRSVLMMVGPEGDFTPAELALAKSYGCLPITLGPIILRVETAAIYCLSVLSYELF